jgi:arylsulfatase A-like enzyme
MERHIPAPIARVLCGAVVAAATIAAGGPEPGDRPTPPPNVIVILVDDLGWRDLGCQGSDFYETPHIDRLAASGMRFTQGYSACTVCSPTRAAILTGQYPARLHVTDWIPGHERPDAKLSSPDWTKHLPLAVVTLAERLSAAGYATASIGKWHLGGPAFFPEHQGFDENIGGDDRGQPSSYFSPFTIPTLAEGPAGEYLTDREAAEAVKFITARKDSPFFLSLPHACVHAPIRAKRDVTARYAAKSAPRQEPRNNAYAAMVESVDDSLGRILATLEELGIRDNTAIFFTSDNGGLAGVETDPEQPLDGRDLAALLAGGALDRDAIYWHYPHYHPGGATPYSAIRSGPWRLVHFYEDDRDELYDLAADPGKPRIWPPASPPKPRPCARSSAPGSPKSAPNCPCPTPTTPRTRTASRIASGKDSLAAPSMDGPRGVARANRAALIASAGGMPKRASIERSEGRMPAGSVRREMARPSPSRGGIAVCSAAGNAVEYRRSRRFPSRPEPPRCPSRPSPPSIPPARPFSSASISTCRKMTPARSPTTAGSGWPCRRSGRSSTAAARRS